MAAANVLLGANVIRTRGLGMLGGSIGGGVGLFGFE